MDCEKHTKQRLYMIQACNQQDDFFPLPYSIGVLATYAWQNAEIQRHFTLCDLVGEKFDWAAFPDWIVCPDVVVFSCYIWNFVYSKQLARAIKERFPQCTIVFGGHSIPIHESDLLTELPYVDYLLHGEGEIPLTELLLFLCRKAALEDVHNVSYRAGTELVYRYNSAYVVQDYPSPYLTGLFDRFFDMRAKRYTATLETNRGCPFRCGYCDWGLNSTRPRMMDLQKVLDEIEWMGKNHILTCYGADSNFGMFPRDVEIAKKIAETKRRHGYPKKFSVSFSKQSDEKVLEISQVLHDCQALAGATLSFQSLCPETLEQIGRRNLSLHYFQKLIAEYNKSGIPTYSEIILALPAETYDSFLDGLCALIENGQYRYINVYNFTLLTNSELGKPEAVRAYGLKTVRIPQKTYYCYLDEGATTIQEVSDIVVETATMTRADWVRCRMFTAVLKGFHSFGFLLYIASYLHQSACVSYRAFYEALCHWLLRKVRCTPYMELEKWLFAVVHGEASTAVAQDEFDGYRIPEDEAAFLKLNENRSQVYGALLEFLAPYGGDGCWDELIRFQRTVMDLIYNKQAHAEQFSYDFISYFNAIASGVPTTLMQRPTYLSRDSLKMLFLIPKKIYIPEKNSLDKGVRHVQQT